ncbi:hypothetical protein [Bacillus chungangensis]|uniref:Uncharacterized protein n=1 Tax=Bacillus chungangensis TaxID=587633 RepID=A0ABT9WMA6_9BACI|nr:hypothetical protein [Bacillus chungangensis]MDQ0174413.1 hypothetical protein [Bacillus chungangensis]
MEVIEIHNTIDEDEMREALTIQVNGKTLFNVFDGEPEDRLLMRDFNDCYNIVDLMRLAYQAGRDGEGFSHEIIDESEGV